MALVFAVYVPTLNDYFHGDDYLAFIDLTTKEPWPQIRDVFAFADSNVYWRPLGHVYYFAIYSLAGLDAYYFHLASVGLLMLTLVLLYKFSVGFGLNRHIALAAVLIFGILPNHVVSVAWVTNAPRLLAVLFALWSLVLVQQCLRKDRRRYEVLAFLAMALAVLSDEVAVSLTPLPLLYALLSQRSLLEHKLANSLRLIAFGALGLAVTILQFTVGKTEGEIAPAVISLTQFGIGPHIPREFWALASKLVLPTEDGVTLTDIAPAQWVAGAVAGVLALMALVAGTKRAWFLIAWIALALAPFTLWETPIAPARYVYMAAVPFAVLVAWSVASLMGAIWRWRPFVIVQRAGLSTALYLLVALIVGAGGTLAAQETIARNETYARQAEPYRALAENLPRALPSVPPHSRLVIYYGVWDGSFVWQDAVVQTIFKDRTLTTVNVDAELSEELSVIPLPRDIVVYYTERGFILPSLSRPTQQPSTMEPPKRQPGDTGVPFAQPGVTIPTDTPLENTNIPVVPPEAPPTPEPSPTPPN